MSDLADELQNSGDALVVEAEHEGFIWPSRSGVAWANQTHGLACWHSMIEGVFIPAGVPLTVKTLMLDAGSVSPMSEEPTELLDEIDAAFIESRSPFKVCRNRLGKFTEGGSGEAWLWVEVTDDAGSLFAFAGEKGVLVWTNSD